MPQTFSFVKKSNTLNATAQFWYSWQSIIVSSVSWQCNSNTQSKCWSQKPKRDNSCSSFLSGGATVSTRVEIFKLSCRPPAFVISAVLNWLGVFVIGTTFPFIVVSASAWGAPATAAVTVLCQPGVLLAPAPHIHFFNWRALTGPRYSFRPKYLSKVKMERIAYQIQTTLGDALRGYLEQRLDKRIKAFKGCTLGNAKSHRGCTQGGLWSRVLSQTEISLISLHIRG